MGMLKVTLVNLIGSPEVHAGGSHPGQEPAATQTVGSVAGRHRADQLEVRGGAAEGVSLEGDFLFVWKNVVKVETKQSQNLDPEVVLVLDDLVGSVLCGVQL